MKKSVLLAAAFLPLSLAARAAEPPAEGSGEPLPTGQLEAAAPACPQPSSPRDALSVMPLHEMEKQLILKSLDETSGNRTLAAQLLGISVRTLRNKLNEYREQGLEVA